MKDTNIERYQRLESPEFFKEKIKLSPKARLTVMKAREDIIKIFSREDKRKIFIIGPCSIHNYDEAIEYAKRLKQASEKVQDKVLILMRVYLEKPRTNIGWKGFINDPYLDSSFNISKGIELSRKLLLEITELGVPVATEFLDVLTYPYIQDFISYGAIGARTSESQTHRQMVSGLAIPIGYKNSTSGNIMPAINAIKVSKNPHHFIGINDSGEVAVVNTIGNSNCNIILRGGDMGPNYEPEFVSEVEKRLDEEGIEKNIIIDCNHGNSLKDFTRQPEVFREVAFEMRNNPNIAGLMLESNLEEGSQKPDNFKALKKGVSVTDGCIDWTTTERLINDAYSIF